jgi:hypothetical protein
LTLDCSIDNTTNLVLPARDLGKPFFWSDSPEQVVQIGAGEAPTTTSMPGRQAAAERAEGDEADAQRTVVNSSIGSRVTSDYSLCRAVTGCTAHWPTGGWRAPAGPPWTSLD